ncbi:BTAD domain-containing putative transcriptional regulator [Frankia sp. Cr1]|uniref:BTAD domain-containing putative transcriptional regulator n=1 Tax=Frankia sp. Cr1 TaxID=3073931 RepID=UPI002AD20AFD|nr:winged helix-turn-helix domain-containing protein [Frankia sp. Cr1]
MGDADFHSVVPARVRRPPLRGIRRPRLTDMLGDAAGYRLALVVAPAGAGKTTLLTDVAQRHDGPVAWLTLDTRLDEVEPFLAHLRTAVDDVVRAGFSEWATMERALAELEARLNDPLLLVLDDLHTIDGNTVDGNTVENCLQLLLDYLPRNLVLLVASRVRPALSMDRLRLAGQVREVDADELRFRTWEVEELFHNCHGVRLRPEEVAALARSTGGWAAGLQLFHLATQGRPASERAKLLAGLGGTRLTREYLTTHVLNAVSADDRDFLVQTSAFDRLTGQRCDVLLERTDSANRLADLERRGLFTFVEGDGRTYRYHEVLRVHLLERLVIDHGEAAARAVHRKAAQLCEADGALGDAVRAFCRSADWDQVHRLVGQQGRSLVDEPTGWADLLPPSIRDHDPWVLLALARRLVAEGSLDAALDTYREAGRRFGVEPPVQVGREASALHEWLNPAPRRAASWLHVMRAAFDDPSAHIHGPADTPQLRLARAVAALVAGDIATARQRFEHLVHAGDTALMIEAAALLGRAICAVFGNEPDARMTANDAVWAAEAVDSPQLFRLCAGVAAMAVDATPHVEHLRESCRRSNDRWGAALLTLLAGLTGLAEPNARLAAHTLLVAAERECADLDATALVAWANAGLLVALRSSGQPVDSSRARAVLRTATAIGPLPHALALIGSAGPHAVAVTLATNAGAGAWLRLLVADPDSPDGVTGPAVTGPAATAHPPVPRLVVRCLGGLALELDGRTVDLSAVQPRNLELLGLLAVNANRLLPRDRLMDAIWPDAGPAQAGHSLQVAISAIRRLLEPDTPRSQRGLLRRVASSYRLVLHDDGDLDIHRVRLGLRRAASVRRGRDDGPDPTTEYQHLIDAVDLYTGDVLPEYDLPDLIVEERTLLRDAVAGACERAAEIASGDRRHADAVRLAERGLEIDLHRDGLWHLLMAALRGDGHHAAATSAQTRYAAVLTDLGIVPPGLVQPPHRA